MGAYHRIDTTLGELIETLSEVSLDYCNDKREAYILAGIVLEEILRKASLAEESCGGRHAQPFRKSDFH